ncbi:DUF4160 domain-containing protein [Pseudomonas orientalis]|uniref:DUF4160 domain-containing protein n=1 Tax=Pseudomonas orientalis TaxID=76758 RepID=A0A8B3XWQ3_9PSED|nr:DUF4160 domain-containing protein [Pseudomonas orientalis]SDU03110.1 protein of unknown function [Pseudomonas orientalis]
MNGLWSRLLAALGMQNEPEGCARENISLAFDVMATLHSERNWKIKIYPDDHAPPHFHVQTPEGESLVQIEGLVVLGTGAEKKALKAALLWASAHIADLKRVWDEQNRRD